MNLADQRAHLGALGFKHRRRAGDLNGRSHLADLEGNVDAEALFGLQVDASEDLALEAAYFGD